MTEIIVYRNPADAALWQMLSGGEFFPVLVGAIVGVLAVVLAVVLAAKVFDKVFGAFRQPKWAGNLTLVIGAAVWVATTYVLWI